MTDLEDLKEYLTKQNETVVTAESCTGGRIASYLTTPPGSSGYFLGSVVSYSNEIKNKVLHVPENVLKEKGAVSEETVSYMAKGALNLMGADWSLVSSGVAGPSGGTEFTPVGFVWMAIGQKNKDPLCWSQQFEGDRKSVMDQTVTCLIKRFLSVLRNG